MKPYIQSTTNPTAVYEIVSRNKESGTAVLQGRHAAWEMPLTKESLSKWGYSPRQLEDIEQEKLGRLYVQSSLKPELRFEVLGHDPETETMELLGTMAPFKDKMSPELLTKYKYYITVEVCDADEIL